MSYEKKSIRILAGGLNLLAPSDIIDDSEATELLNFSTDSAGSLKSRRGHTLRYNVSGEAVAMTRALGSLWVGAGGNVYKDGALVISGLSADRMGLVGFANFIWAMSEADQRKSDGTNDYKWIPEAPTDPPTIAPAVAVETEVVDLTGGFTVDPEGDETYASGTLQINAQSDTVYTATKDISLDIGTGFSLDDVFEIRVWCRQWRKINRVVFEIDVNDGTFEKDYYTAEMLKAKINAGAKETVTFYIRKRPQSVDVAAKDKKRYGAMERIGTAAGKDYRSCVKVRIKVDYADTTKIRFEKWSLIGDVSNTLEGDDFRVAYTYTTASGHESNPSPLSEPITVNRTGIDVSAMVASLDPQVTGQNVYLTGGTLQAVLRVNGNTPVVGTTYQIRANDDDLEDDGLELEDDHSQPPQVSGAIGPYYNRIIAFGNRRYYWSHINRVYAFAFPDDESGGDWNPVEESVGDLLAATMRPGVLFLYGTNNLAVVQGDPGGDSAVHSSAVKQGIRSARGVCQSPRGDIANFSEGVYLCNGDSAEVISKKIESVFKDAPKFDATKAAIGFRGDVAWVSDGTSTYKFDFLTQRWFQDSRLFSCFFNDEDALVGGTPDGDVVDLESGFSDAGASFTVSYRSKAYDCSITDCEKTFNDFTGWANTASQNLTVVAILNEDCDDEFTVALGVVNSSAEERFVFQFNDEEGVKARTCTITITGSVSAEVEITKMVLNFYPEQREARTWDSDERDEGTVKVKEVFKVQVDYDSAAPVQLIVQSDQPGFAMQTRDSAHSFGISSTRIQDMYVLPESIMGHNLRYLLDGSDFRHYGMRAELQIIGTLLHGSKGEYYRSDPIGRGNERVKLYKEIHVKYATAGTALMKVETELPDGSIAEVGGSPFTLTGTGGIRFRDIQTRKIRLRGNTKGRMILITITPTDDFRLEELQDFEKTVGASGVTPWGWAPFPVESTQPAVWQSIFAQPDAIG